MSARIPSAEFKLSKSQKRILSKNEDIVRAFVNRKLNLLQAESVIQLINAKSVEAVKQQTKNVSTQRRSCVT